MGPQGEEKQGKAAGTFEVLLWDHWWLVQGWERMFGGRDVVQGGECCAGVRRLDWAITQHLWEEKYP